MTMSLYPQVTKLFIFISLLCAAIVRAEPPRLVVVEPVVHALLIADTRAAKIGDSVERDRSHVSHALTRALGKQVKISEISGNDVSIANVDKWFRDWKGNQGVDSIFVFVAGHGAWEDGRGHFMQFANGENLYRNHLRAALLTQGARQSVLITDTCGTRSIRPRVHVVYRKPEGEDDFTLLRRLLVNGTGLIDVNSAAAAQSAHGNDEFGGWFTYHMLRSIRDNSDRNLTWNQVIDDASTRVRPWLPEGTKQDAFKFHSSRIYNFNQSYVQLKNYDPERTLRVRVRVRENGEDSPIRQLDLDLKPHELRNTELLGTEATISVPDGRGGWTVRDTLRLRPAIWNSYSATALQTVTYSFPALAPAPRPFPGR